ncbi:hypothetical protein [Paraburkholderia sp. 2C]
MLRAISAPQAWINRKVTIYHLKRITPIFLPSDSDGFLEISAIFSRFVRNYSIAQYGNMPLDDRISQDKPAQFIGIPNRQDAYFGLLAHVLHDL